MASVRIFHQPSGEDAAVRIARALYAQGFEISTLEQEKFPIAGSMSPTLDGVARGFDVAIAVIPEGGDREGWIRRELSTQAHLYPEWLIALGSHLPKSGREAERVFHFHEDPARWVAACMLRQGKDPRRPSPSPRRPLPGPMKPFDPTMLVRAAVENGKPVQLQAALAVLREATEVAEIVELAIQKQDGFMIVGGPAASVDTSPRTLDSSARPVDSEPPDPERAMLGLIRAGGDEASWSWIGQRTSGVMSAAIAWQALLEGLRAPQRPSWDSLQPLLALLEVADAAALEPELARWSDEERTSPLDIWEKGASIPKTAKLHGYRRTRKTAWMTGRLISV